MGPTHTHTLPHWFCVISPKMTLGLNIILGLKIFLLCLWSPRVSMNRSFTVAALNSGPYIEGTLSLPSGFVSLPGEVVRCPGTFPQSNYWSRPPRPWSSFPLAWAGRAEEIRSFRPGPLDGLLPRQLPQRTRRQSGV